MKHYFFLSLFAVSFFSARSQLTKNNWLVGGCGSFYSYNQELSYSSTNITAKYTSIDISASIGYFVIDKFAVGLSPTFSSFKGETSGGGHTNTKKFSIGPFARYYLLNVDKPFNILTEASYQIGVNKIPLALKEKGKISNLSFMVGPEIFFNSSVGMEVLLGYKATTETIDDSPSAYDDNRKGFQVSVGFQIHLEKL